MRNNKACGSCNFFWKNDFLLLLWQTLLMAFMTNIRFLRSKHESLNASNAQRNFKKSSEKWVKSNKNKIKKSTSSSEDYLMVLQFNFCIFPVSLFSLFFFFFFNFAQSSCNYLNFFMQFESSCPSYKINLRKRIF